MRIIDTHMHLIQTIAGTGADGELRYIGRGMARYASGKTIRALPDYFPDGTVSPEDLLKQMDSNNVEKAVLLQGNYFGFQNLYSWDAVQRYPNRFRAAASYDPWSRFCDQIRKHLLEELGFPTVKFELSTGSGLMCNHPTFPLDGEIMEEQYCYADEHGLICIMDIGKLGAESWQIEALRNAVLHHPSMRFVICHLLAPTRNTQKELEDGLKRLSLSNVWFDLAALPHNIRPEEYPYETAQRYVARAVDIVGEEKILFGSDVPSTLKEDSYEHLIGFVLHSPLLSETTKESILYRNAENLFFADD